MLRRVIVCVLLGVLFSLAPSYHQVPSASAWPLSVSGGTDRPGAVLALTVRLSGGPRTVGDLIEGFGFGDGIGAAHVVGAGGLVPRVGPGERSDMTAAAADAWLAANRALGTELEYQSLEVVVDVEKGSVAEASGVGEGDVVDLLPDRVLATRDGELRSLDYRNLQGAETVTIDESVLPRPALMVRRRSYGLSVGLAAALAYLDELAPSGITGGRVLAATGVINQAGWVSAVTNADLKATAAVAAGAEVMFVPTMNLDDACAGAAGRIPVVGVRHLGDVLGWLEGNRAWPSCADAAVSPVSPG